VYNLKTLQAHKSSVRIKKWLVSDAGNWRCYFSCQIKLFWSIRFVNLNPIYCIKHIAYGFNITWLV